MLSCEFVFSSACERQREGESATQVTLVTAGPKVIARVYIAAADGRTPWNWSDTIPGASTHIASALVPPFLTFLQRSVVIGSRRGQAMNGYCD